MTSPVSGTVTAAGGLYGGGGNDYLDGGNGLDDLYGGDDDDTLLAAQAMTASMAAQAPIIWKADRTRPSENGFGTARGALWRRRV